MFGRNKHILQDPFSAIGTVFGAITGTAATTATAATIFGAVGTIGTWLGVIGGVTGNEKLAKFGGVLGIAGGLGNMFAQGSASGAVKATAQQTAQETTKAGLMAAGESAMPAAASSTVGEVASAAASNTANNSLAKTMLDGAAKAQTTSPFSIGNFLKDNKDLLSVLGSVADKMHDPLNDLREKAWETEQRNANDIPAYKSNINPNANPYSGIIGQQFPGVQYRSGLR